MKAAAVAFSIALLSTGSAFGSLVRSSAQEGGAAHVLLFDRYDAARNLTIDRFVQRNKLIGCREAGGGSLVALSQNGNTALISCQEDNPDGAVLVFTRFGSTWKRQGKLTGSGQSGHANFGDTLALSGDGNTALVGGVNDNDGIGAAWVFARSGSTWKQQGKKLTGSGESGYPGFGSSVALSSDGNVALIGGSTDGGDQTGPGAAWVFARSGSTWKQQGKKLTGKGNSGDDEFGNSVALSSDANTALIGGNGARAAWIFMRSGSSWKQQGSKLTGTGETSNDGSFGDSVALSGDGTIALIGGMDDHGSGGAAWIFGRSGSTWRQLGGKLTGRGETSNGLFGSSVALSGSGSTALIGGEGDNKRGAAWIFSRTGSTWRRQGGKLTGRGANKDAAFGASVGLSRDGKTALVGAGGQLPKGAAWIFSTTR